jgi:hypothetical protein
MSQIAKNSEEEIFWKDVCDSPNDSPQDLKDCAPKDETNSKKFNTLVTKCQGYFQNCLNHEVGRWMLIFFVATLSITFLILLIVNPPLVQINKRLDKRRSFFKIMGISLLMAIIATIAVPVGVKVWKYYQNRNGGSKTKQIHPLTPHIQLTPL